MEPTALSVARQFATALDANDLDSVRPLLAPDCRYDTGKGILTGPDVILASYSHNADKGRNRIDEVTFTSQVEDVGPGYALVHFTDHIRHANTKHVYRCHQRLRVEAGQVVEIVHEELPGERERLNDFFARVGIQW